MATYRLISTRDRRGCDNVITHRLLLELTAASYLSDQLTKLVMYYNDSPLQVNNIIMIKLFVQVLGVNIQWSFQSANNGLKHSMIIGAFYQPPPHLMCLTRNFIRLLNLLLPKTVQALQL